MQTATRNANLNDLAEMLKTDHARKVDIVAPAQSIASHGGRLRIHGTEPVLTPDGVTMSTGDYLPTAVCDEGIATKLGVPLAYVRRMRTERVDLYDANVNGWLHGNGDGAGDTRSFLVRCFRSDDTGEGVARAFLSDRYKVVDNLDVLVSALGGIEDAGVNVNVEGCDLTDRKMYVRVVAPEVQGYAETLLKGYRNPFGEDFDRWREIADREGMGYGDGSEPIVFAGFVISNSETGGGAFTIVPRVVVKVCRNGLTITRDAMRQVHLGGKMEEGVVEWSEDTQDKSMELVRAKTRDAVKTFLSPGYLEGTIRALEVNAAQPVSTVDEVKVLTKGLRIPLEQVDGILARFIQGGQLSRGGVMSAITAHASTLADADVAHDLEAVAVGLLV